MKFKRKSDNTIIEVTNADAIKRFQSYPDLFEAVKVTTREPKNKEE